MYEITKSDITRGRKLLAGAIVAPIALTATPAIITLLLMLLAPFAPPTAVIVLFLGVVLTCIGFLAGIFAMGLLIHKRTKWTREMREKIAAHGIRAEHISWFMHELKSSEKRALKAVEARDLLLADAYKETLASRLTATRIIKLSKRELQLAKKRQNSIKQLKSVRGDEFREQISGDLEKISKIGDEAKLMLSEAEARLQMIEAATSRGGNLAESELALRKLSARASELPLALESAKMAEEIRKELENAPAEPSLELEPEN